MIDRFLTWLFGLRTVPLPGRQWALIVPRWWGNGRVRALAAHAAHGLANCKWISLPKGVQLENREQP